MLSLGYVSPSLLYSDRLTGFFHRDQSLNISTTVCYSCTRNMIILPSKVAFCNVLVRFTIPSTQPTILRSIDRFPLPRATDTNDTGTISDHHGCYICLPRRGRSRPSATNHARFLSIRGCEAFRQRKRRAASLSSSSFPTLISI